MVSANGAPHSKPMQPCEVHPVAALWDSANRVIRRTAMIKVTSHKVLLTAHYDEAHGAVHCAVSLAEKWQRRNEILQTVLVVDTAGTDLSWLH